MVVMRYPEGHKDEVRRRIVEATSAALRASGLTGASIPLLMKRAGMTHGGFYAHFRDRDELVAEAVLAGARETAERLFADELGLDAAIETYLSRGHLDHPEAGCVLAALGAEGARQEGPVRRAFAEAARGLLRLLEKKIHPRGQKLEPSDETLVRASTMVGALVLGRLVDDAGLSARILAAARKATRR